MPSESSSVVTNATNGIEPPRSLITTKLNKTGGIKMVVPSVKSLGNKYTLAWDIKDNSGINKMVSVIQKMGRPRNFS
jgi:ribonucleoside-diphosphate reductase alpha chain